LRLLKYTLYFCLAVLLSLVLIACSQGSSEETLTPTRETALVPSPSPSPRPKPTSTPLPPMAVLLASPEADPALAGELQAALADLAAQSGLRFQSRPSIAPAELGQIKVVIALPPYPGLEGLAVAAPDTQFLAIGFTGLEERSNLSVVGAREDRPDQLAFLAGYTAAAITDDWRVAVISEAETVAGRVAGLGFTNGATFYCGLCLPVFPPFPAGGYPLSVELTAGAGSEDWQAAVTYLSSWQIGAVYVQPALAEESFLAVLAQTGINFILDRPAPAGLEGNLAASLGYKHPLEDALSLWPDLVAGQGGQWIDLPLGFSQVNPDLLSPGRQRLAEGMLADLLAGFIGTGVDPLTGETP